VSLTSSANSRHATDVRGGVFAGFTKGTSVARLGSEQIVGRPNNLGLTDLYCVQIRIIKAKYALSPRLPLDRMDQFHMRRDAFERRIDILMFEIPQQISLAVGLCFDGWLPPNCLSERWPIVDREAGLEDNEVPEIPQYFQTEPILVKLL
jgi:hypothetical protein